VDAHTFSKQAEKVEINVVCQKADGNCFCGGQDRVMMVELMKQGTTITSEVYCETLKNCVGSFRKKDVEC
jgi:hypothetical protein